MYVEEIKLKRGNKQYRCTLIRESYRQAGKVLHRTVCNISKLPAHVIEQIRASLRSAEGEGASPGPLNTSAGF